MPINESWGVSDIALRRDQQDFATSLYYLTKAIDPTRPVISNEGWEHTISDIWGIHDYTQFKEQLDRPLRHRRGDRRVEIRNSHPQSKHQQALRVGFGQVVQAH